MHPERRAWTQLSSEDDSYNDNTSTSEESSSDEEPVAKTRTKRSNELVCSAAEAVSVGSRVEPFYSMMKESFNNVILSDVTILINSLRFPAHSFVLAAQCDFFKDALTKSGLKKEAVKEFWYETGQPHAYWRMLEYLYKGTYSIQPAAEVADRDDELILNRHIHVYAVAEAFAMDGLQRLATQRFKQSIEEEKINKRTVSCIQLIFETTKNKNNVLRKEVMEIVGRHVTALWEMEEFQSLVRGGGDFAIDFVAKLLEGI